LGSDAEHVPASAAQYGPTSSFGGSEWHAAVAVAIDAATTTRRTTARLGMAMRLADRGPKSASQKGQRRSLSST
jgi:hypothetical protein